MKEIYNNLYRDLYTYSYNNFSQNGEDGILEEIFNRLGISNFKTMWCVEFGAWDGIYLSNTFNIVKKGCNAIYIEGNKKRFKELLVTKKKHPQILAINKEVSHKIFSKNSLDNILKKTKLPKDFDILSIDIDSFDLLIWESFVNYQPKVVVIEINSSYPPGIKKWHSNKYKNSNGNSFSATLKVGENKGYKLVAHSGNMIFVRNDLIDKIKLDERYLIYPELLFNDLWYAIEKRNFIYKSLLKIKAFIKRKILKRLKEVLKIDKLYF